MNFKKILATMLFSTLLFTGCSVGKNGNAIIRVNDKSITQADFEEAFSKVAKNPSLAMFKLNDKNVDKNGFMYLMLKEKVVNQIIIESLVNDELDKRNIKVTKKDVSDEYKNIIDSVGSKEKFEGLLKQNGITPKDLKNDLQEELKIRKLVNTIEKVNISEADAKNYYNKNLDKFKVPEKVRASHILILANEDEIKASLSSKDKNLSDEEINKETKKLLAEKKAKAESILNKVKNDTSAFAKLARENSEDTGSAKNGGDLGFFTRQEMVPQFSDAAFKLKPNTVSSVVTTPYGYHIIMVTDRVAPSTNSFEKVKKEIILYLETQKKIGIFENFVEGLKKNAKIEYLNDEYNPKMIQSAIRQNSTATPVNTAK